MVTFGKDMDTVTVKGTSDGLVIILGNGPLPAVLSEMETHLQARASFFLGGRVALQVGERSLAVGQLQEIGHTLEQLGMTLWAVDSEHPDTLLAAQELGLETLPQTASQVASRQDVGGLVVRRTLRSGQAIHHAGHVTLIGDVNAGAEIVAGGDIIIWGKLLGTAHAGAMGDEGAIICALQMTPRQIRIGSHIARSPERSRRPKAPEMASVQQEGIVVERWKRKQEIRR